MSSGQSRGRGGGRGGGRGREGRGAKGRQQGGRGDSQGQRGDSQDQRGGRGDFQGQRGRGDGQDRGGRGGRGRGGPPGTGQSTQMAFRGPPPGSGSGGIYLGPAPPPDPQVTAAEDKLVAVTRDVMFEGIPGRRGYGTKGKPTVLRTNYFKVHAGSEGGLTDVTWYRYDVSVTQDLSRPKKRRLLDTVLKDAKFRDKIFATDYANIIVTTTKLDFKGKDVWEDKVTLPPEDGKSTQDGDEDDAPDFVQQARERNRIPFKVAYSGSYSLMHLLEYLRSPSAGAEYAGGDDLKQLVNIVICKAPQAHARVANVGQNKFYPFEDHVGLENYDLGGGLQALRGYFASVRPAITRLLVNINVTSGVFYKPLPLLDLIQQSGIRNYEQIEGFLHHLRVRAVYKRDRDSQAHMAKLKSIVGFAKPLTSPPIRVKRFGNANEVKFRYNDQSGPSPRQRELTVADYFRQERGITLRSPELPVLNVTKRDDPQYLPMELCTVLPGQPHRRLISGDQTTAMLNFAARPPNLNAVSIAGKPDDHGNGLKLFRLGNPSGVSDMQADSVKPFGFSVETQMISVPARILDSPRVNYRTKAENPRNASWNCANQKFSVPGRHGKWQVLVINRKGPRGNALIESPTGDMLAPEALFNLLAKTLKDYDITMGERVTTRSILLEPLTLENRDSNDMTLRNALQRANGDSVRMLFIVLPEADKWLYSRIKLYCDVKFGMHSINAVGNKLQKPGGQGMFMGNLALKFNIKGGGVSHKVQNTLSKPLDSNTMLVGIDVTHPSPGSSKEAPSIAAVVASVDEFLFQFPGSIRIQDARLEMVRKLGEMVRERLLLWQSKHKKLPTRIVLYRDGVSEGQYNLVLEQEWPGFEEAFKGTYGAKDNWPKVSIIIVGKRHHTRFYPTREEDADYNPQRQKGSWNPLPGTIVDRGIADKVKREFWLQAHQGLQGTARPAHYVVIKDDIKFEADELEQLTLKMCYLFSRATKAVSICPPAYYADLLCERGRAYLHSTLGENHNSESSGFSRSSAEWTGGVHERLKDSTWYI